MTGSLPVWIDGVLHARSEAALPADDSAALEGLGCYTTTRVAAGVPLWPRRHAQRLVRDAAALELGELSFERALDAIVAASRETLPGRDGALRIQCSRDARATLRLVAVPRELGANPDTWTAIRCPDPHYGPQPWGGAKLSAHLSAAVGRRAAKAAGCDEALLFDREGFLIEGARSTPIVVFESGESATPDLARGGVAGIARSVVLESAGSEGPVVRDIRAEELAGASELIAINAIRGARAIVRLGDRQVGDGRSGPLAQRLDALLATADDSSE